MTKGYADAAPYDAIVIEGSVTHTPEALLGQLKDGGRLVVVEGVGNAALALIYTRSGDVTSPRPTFNAAIKPLPGFELAQGFSF